LKRLVIDANTLASGSVDPHGESPPCLLYSDLAGTRFEAILRDSEDDYLVALARKASAEAIVTGDKDLLDHVGLEPNAISPREACELLGLV
jgi:predicted nucleic acid-binding protein